MMTTAAKPRPSAVAGNTSTELLKLIALAFMFMDHAGKMCFPLISELRLFGRLAFPLYCWCMAVGASYTRSMPRYLLRLGVVGLISQPVYMVALNHPWNVPNIFLTLMLGLMGVWGLQKRRWLSHIWAPVAAMCLALILRCDAASYGWKGVLLVMLLYGARESRGAIAAVMIAFCLYWGTGGVSVTSFFGLPLSQLMRGELASLISPFLKMQTLAVCALPLMIWPDEIRLRIPAFLRGPDDEADHVTLRTRMPRVPMPRWLGYSIYPLHLALLIALEYAMGKTVHWEHLSDAWTQFIALF